MSENIQWTGDNLADVQAFVGIMENMDGDVRTARFLEPEALDEDGDRIWEDPRARLWVEEVTHWVPVDIGDWIVRRSGVGMFGLTADE